MPARRTRPPAEGHSPDRAPVRVLVVDDSETFCRIAAEVVAVTPGFALAGVATSGEQALEVAAEQRPDLVLMDVRMPGMGGIAAAERLAAAASPPRVVLVSTGERADTPGATAVDLPYLAKSSFDPEALSALWARAEP
jgi:CheY-like chemotaxis protein